MKAWKAEDKRDGFYSTVVFAETRGQAKSAAKATDCCEDADWTDIRVTRAPELDGEYRGHTEMEWYDDQDRIALIKNGWHCEEVWLDECETCVGRDECETYKDYLADMEITKVLEGANHGHEGRT